MSVAAELQLLLPLFLLAVVLQFLKVFKQPVFEQVASLITPRSNRSDRCRQMKILNLKGGDAQTHAMQMWQLCGLLEPAIRFCASVADELLQ